MSNYSESEWGYIAWLDALAKVLAEDHGYDIVELLAENPRLASVFDKVFKAVHSQGLTPRLVANAVHRALKAQQV